MVILFLGFEYHYHLLVRLQCRILANIDLSVLSSYRRDPVLMLALYFYLVAQKWFCGFSNRLLINNGQDGRNVVD